MANIITTILLYIRKWLQGRKQPWEPSAEPMGAKNVIVDTSIRAKAEKDMRAQGVIAGSVLQAPRGFETAYLRIMADVEADNSAKANLYTALANGSQTTIYEKFLLPCQWKWPEFEKWKNIFLKDGKFPYMWEKYPEICMRGIEELSFNTILERTYVKDIKEILNKLQIDIPHKIKKVELIKLAVQKIDIKILRENFPDIYENIKNNFEKQVNHGRCAILEHTIVMLGYQLRNFYSYNNLKLYIIKGCPIEAKYAKGKGKITEYNIPPFFPGDRTSVTPVRRSH